MHRETGIMKELSLMNKIGAQNFSTVEKHFRKMIRKIMVLSLDKPSAAGSTSNAQTSHQLGYGVSYRSRQHQNTALNNSNQTSQTTSSLPLSENLPSHLHLAAVMGERTAIEKQTFGKLTLDSGQTLTESKIDWLISKFIEG